MKVFCEIEIRHNSIGGQEREEAKSKVQALAEHKRHRRRFRRRQMAAA